MYSNYISSLALFLPKVTDNNRIHTNLRAAFMIGLFSVTRRDGALSCIFTDQMDDLIVH